MDRKSGKLVDDLSQLAAGAASVAQTVRDDLRQAIDARVDALLTERGFVSREEFEIVRDMAEKARSENEDLRARLDAFENQSTD